jgi:two-component system nitrogen regulation response regulator GlnG
MTRRLWIIDDEPVICSTLKRAFAAEGLEVEVFASAEAAIAEACQRRQRFGQEALPTVILIDVRLPGMDGIDAIERLRQDCSKSSFIVMTAFGDLVTAVRAVEASVFEYLTKPFDLGAALACVRRCFASVEAGRQQGRHEAEPEVEAGREAAEPVVELLGRSAAMQKVFQRIAMAAMADCPVLLCGESGTGKEVVARAIHRYGLRKAAPYLAMAPAALSPALIESEMFGHARGAYTGAEAARRGILELAEDGTILLDEIGDLPLPQQVKLLRVLEQREFSPVGSSEVKGFRARVIAATHKDLKQLVDQGSFRSDLYFRLAVFTIQLPPLRERQEDILPLALSFLQRFGYPLDAHCVLDPPVIHFLEHDSWPGNVRELRNTMEHAAMLARGNRIFLEHLPRRVPTTIAAVAASGADLPGRFEHLVRDWVEASQDRSSLYAELMTMVEPPLIKALLERSGGNRAAAAQALGLHRSTLRQKLLMHHIDVAP